MGIRACFYFVILFFSQHAFGTITLLSFGDTSTYSGETGLTDITNFNNVTIYGGVAGPENAEGCTDATSASTCNNCAVSPPDTPSATCSTRRVHSQLNLTVSFTTTGFGRLLVYAGPFDRSLTDLTNYELIENFQSTATNNIFGTVERTETTVQFSCLLYTSPSPRDGLLSRMPSSA